MCSIIHLIMTVPFSLIHVECSKILLASRSEYFHQMFTRKENQEKICHIIILDSSFEAVKCAIHPSMDRKKTLNEKLKKRVQFLLTKFNVDHMIDGKSSEVGDMIKPAKKTIFRTFF